MFKFLADNRSANVLAVSDWLLNMRDAFLQMWAESAHKTPSSSRVLTLFTLSMSCQSTRNFLYIDNKLVMRVGKIFLECRGYYTCLWQLYLLMKAETDKDFQKVQYLSAMVDSGFVSAMEGIFADNKKIKDLFEIPISDEYDRLLTKIVPIYIHKSAEAESWVGHMTSQMSLQMTQYVSSVELWPKVSALVIDDTMSSLSTRMLADFDLKNCEVLEVPKEFLRDCMDNGR